MGTEGQNIVKGDVKKVIDFLRSAFADEWIAYYMYWISAKVARGLMRESIVSELEEHAKEEEEHANDIAERIIELGGTPSMTPDEWGKVCNCAYETPDEDDIVHLLEQNLDAEKCAIKTYNKALEDLKDNDRVSYQVIVKILKDEVHHEEDLQALLEDIKLTKNMKLSSIVDKIVKSAGFKGMKITEEDSPLSQSEIGNFTDAYIEAMLWSSTDDNDEPLDENYDVSDIATEFMSKIKRDCKKFLRENYQYIEEDEMKQAGHDFWLTRNGHGAGFWDGDWDYEINGKNVGDHLTKEAKKFGEVIPYIGDDGKIYGG